MLSNPRINVIMFSSIIVLNGLIIMVLYDRGVSIVKSIMRGD